MTPFAYTRPSSVADALAARAREPDAAYLGGGTTLLDLMKQGVERPSALLDLHGAHELSRIEVAPDGTLVVGAMATLAHVARHKAVRAGWPLLHEAIVKGLTPQLRNAATFGGNITQRPRCIYFREADFACNKRRPGSGCAAREGVHYGHAVFGGADAQTCIAVHPSDLCVALTALNARVTLQAPGGTSRTSAITDYHRLPGDDPARETTLAAGELVTALHIPPQAGSGAYSKAPREGFALASAAVIVAAREGRVTASRIVLGGVAHKPWEAENAARVLIGRSPHDALEQAAEAALEGIETDVQTEFRRALLRGVVLEALQAAVQP